MNSIIKQITYDQFTSLIGNQKVQIFLNHNKKLQQNPNNQAPYLLLCFIADWSVPSRTAIKKIKKKSHFIQNAKQKIGIIDVDLVDSIDQCQKYQIKSVPYFILFKASQIIQKFSGCRLEMIDEVFIKLIQDQKGQVISPGKKDNITCPSKHQPKILTKLPNPPYIDNYFYCNICKKVQQCTQKYTCLHCEQCDWDICYSCNGQ